MEGDSLIMRWSARRRGGPEADRIRPGRVTCNTAAPNEAIIMPARHWTLAMTAGRWLPLATGRTTASLCRMLSSVGLLASLPCMVPGAGTTQAATADDYPNRAIRIIVPFPAGGTADAVPRIVGEKLAQRWGQPVVVENRAGAAGNIGAEMVSRAEPDGYTLMASPPPPLVVNQFLYPKIAYDASLFVPVSVMAAVPTVLAVNPKVPAQTLAEFLALARARPGQINYASQGSGSTSHLTAELFMMATGIRMAHVPYKGSAPGLTDLLAGQVDLMFDNLSSSLGYIRAGRLRALAITSTRRIQVLPDTPALNETLPGLVSTAWFAVAAPPGTPADIVTRLSSAISDAIRLPDVQRRLTDMLAEPMGLSPAESAAFIRQDAERWKRVISGSQIRVE